MSVVVWGWIFLVGYTAMMLALGVVGMRRTKSSDDFATARGAYGGLVLGLSYMAMVASGSTFLGIPGLAYESGFKAGYYPMLYPIGIYLGTMLVVRHMKRLGDRLHSQTVPDFLGDIYRSPVLRAIAALISLFLIYYVMAQLAASGQMFETILGIPYNVGVWVAIGIVMVYMIMGGSHSDIITDAIQGLFMLVVAAFVIVAFLVGAGVEGFGPAAVNDALPAKMQWDVHTDPANPTFSSWWVIVLLLIAHFGFFTLPHLGNKFFALRGTGQARKFVLMSSIVGLAVGFLFLGGVLGRAMGIEDIHPDAVIPSMLTALLPAWTAALLSVAVLSAIISTTDGLLMSISQLAANDLYRKTWIPWRGKDPESPQVDKRALLIGRIGIVVAGVVAGIAVYSPPELLSILLWVGIGGIIATLSGPMFLAIFWRRRANKTGAIAGGLLTFAFYFFIHLGPQFGMYEGFYPFNQNPFASTGVACILGIVLCAGISLLGKPLPADHLAMLDQAESGDERDGAAGDAAHRAKAG
ncbi:MAG: sodium:solute symporter family protein [Streptosporangiales bacterium]|nr:sodium:solute symporter family protein [Streptosporangiales bacterium]